MKVYKNFTIFYDSTRSELMKGFLIYAKLAGREIPREVLESYEKDLNKDAHRDFIDKINSIGADDLKNVFDSYIRTFQEMAEQDKQHAQDYSVILRKIEDTRAIVNESIQELLEKTGNKLDYPAHINDLLENLEKISAGAERTSLRSPDNTVLLNHVRIKNKNNNGTEALCWNFNKETYTFFVEPISRKMSDKIVGNLKLFSKGIIYIYDNGKLSFSCPKKQLDAICNMFDEEKIKEKFHRNDYALYHRLKEEKKSNFIPELDEILDISLACTPKFDKGIFDAIKQDDVDAIETYLMTHPVNEKIDGQGNTLLHLALEGKKEQIIKYLIETSKAEYLLANKNDQHALSLAISKKNIPFMRALLKNLNQQALSKGFPVGFSNKRVKKYFKKPEQLIKECERRFLERTEIKGKLKDDVTKLADELKKIIKTNSKTEKPKRFISFWEDFCGVKSSKSIPLIGNTPQRQLHNYLTFRNEAHFLGVQRDFLENINTLLISGVEEGTLSALKAIEGAKFLKEAGKGLSEKSNQVASAKGLTSEWLTRINEKHTNTMLDSVNYRQNLLGTSKEARDLWRKNKKHTLLEKWRKFVSDAGIEEPLGAETVANIVSSRILLLSDTALCNDQAFDDLFSSMVKCFSKAGRDEKGYWKSVLSGLLALGANPVKVLDNFPGIDENQENDDKVAQLIYAIGQYSEFILTHLQQRAEYIESCVVGLDEKFKRLITATNAFGQALHNKPGFLSSLMVWFSNNRPDSKNSRAHLFASVLQMIYLILTEDLKGEYNERGDRNTGTSLSIARKKYNEYRTKCEELLKQASWFDYSHEKCEFKELVAAFEAVDAELKSLATNRENKVLRHLILDMHRGKVKAEAEILAEQQKTEAAEQRAGAAEQRAGAAEQRAKALQAKLDNRIKQALIRCLAPHREVLVANPRGKDAVLESVVRQVAQEQEESIEYVSGLMTEVMKASQSPDVARASEAGLFSAASKAGSLTNAGGPSKSDSDMNTQGLGN